jgi:hypothetical protein
LRVLGGVQADEDSIHARSLPRRTMTIERHATPWQRKPKNCPVAGA